MERLIWDYKCADCLSASILLRREINRLVAEGYKFRAVELGHDTSFDSKEETWHVYIRVFPLGL